MAQSNCQNIVLASNPHYFFGVECKTEITKRIESQLFAILLVKCFRCQSKESEGKKRV